jgi:uncharacterized protein YneF (UPF0154 family)
MDLPLIVPLGALALAAGVLIGLHLAKRRSAKTELRRGGAAE